MAETKQCLSQQKPGKTCRTDGWLKNQRSLWCEACEEAQAAEDVMIGLFGMGYII